MAEREELSKPQNEDLDYPHHANLRKKIPQMAFTLMLMGIVLPATFYAFKLNNPTPAQVLVAICISLFSGVVFLWIMDATSVLRFREGWVSKSIYGAAIASVLGTSVAVYKDAFESRKYPYEGRWEVSVTQSDTNKLLAERSLVLSYSDSAKVYWGYSDAIPEKNGESLKAAWLEVKQLTPDDGNIVMRLLFNDGSDLTLNQKLEITRDGRVFNSPESQNYKISINRPR